MTLPAESFRIRPSPRSRKHYVVHLATDYPALRSAIRATGIPCDRRQVGLCVSATSLDDPGLLGFLFLVRNAGVGLVVHELTHAAFRAMDRRGTRVEHWVHGRHPDGMQRTHPAEEAFCEILEHLTRDFWRQWYRHGYDRA